MQNTADSAHAVVCRAMIHKDIVPILDQFEEQEGIRPQRRFELYYNEQQEGQRYVIVAEYQGEIVGYVTLYPDCKDSVPFRGKGIPEIKDFHVFTKHQRRGFGTKLMDAVEAIAASIADTVCLGVGLHAGYGSAQRMYVKRGYIPDGTGVWDGLHPAQPYSMVENGDDLVLLMSKKLR